MALNNFPYADLNITNLDYILRQLKTLSGDIYTIQEFLNTKLEQYIIDNLGKLFLEAVYDADTETVTLTLSVQEV